MKKIKSKSLLCIGLLSVNTFFSCTNTRQAMNQNKEEKGLLKKITTFSCTNTKQAMNQNKEEKGLLKKITTRPTAGNMRRAYNTNPKKIIYLAAAGAATIIGSAGVAAYSFSNMSSEGSNIAGFNNTNFTTISPYHYESSTLGTFNQTGWNSNDSTGSTLAYSAYEPSNITVPTYYPIDLAIHQRNNEDLESLLKNSGSKVNEINSPAGPPLTLSIELDNLKAFKMLLAHPDIDVNKINKYSEYPIHKAISRCNRDILTLLLNDGRVNIDVKIGKNTNLVEFARESKCEKVIIKDLISAIDKQKKQNISDLKIKTKK
ncbi:ankyrin repeat domain-containing protein [Candidatus Cardinium hertigii]|uniref:ankyrin repeat domain-containing protein n=1 Tax=Candidatus Cardinium hertigii TaxID=247481 RepID=UPI003D7E4447